MHRNDHDADRRTDYERSRPAPAVRRTLLLVAVVPLAVLAALYAVAAPEVAAATVAGALLARRAPP